MSVVNDVLKNLNERHAKELSVQSMPYLYEEGSSPQYGLWAVFAVIIAASILMGVKLWWDSNQQFLVHSLPAELFFAPKATEVDAPTEPSIKNDLPQSSTAVKASSSVSQTSEPPVNTVAVKTKETQVIEDAITAVQTGNTSKAKNLIKQTPRSIQDELKLHMMVKEQPKSVLPYIERNFPNFAQQPQLLALAAQGEQRSGNHQKAVNLYQQLIRMQPQQAKWRAGLGISLEAAGDAVSAARMYQLALSMDNLPIPLAKFSRNRLNILSQ